MKRITALLFSILLTSALFSQCNDFFAYSKGDFFEQATYDAKGKEIDRQTMSVTDVIESNDMTRYLVSAKSASAKDSEALDLEFKCQDGELTFDGKQLADAVMAQLKSENMELTVEGESGSYPSSIAVGDNLPDNTFKMSMKGAMEGMNLDIVTTVVLHDRSVVGKEQITTEAGSFDCYKISYAMTTTSEVMGMKNESNTKGTDYIAPRVGVVKSESYDEKGRVMSSSALIKTSLK